MTKPALTVEEFLSRKKMEEPENLAHKENPGQHQKPWSIYDYCVLLGLLKQGFSDDEIAKRISRTQFSVRWAKKTIFINESPEYKPDVVAQLVAIDEKLFERQKQKHRKTHQAAWSLQEVLVVMETYVNGKTWEEIGKAVERPANAAMAALRYVLHGQTKNTRYRPSLEHARRAIQREHGELYSATIEKFGKRSGPKASRNEEVGAKELNIKAPRGTRLESAINDSAMSFSPDEDDFDAPIVRRVVFPVRSLVRLFEEYARLVDIAGKPMVEEPNIERMVQHIQKYPNSARRLQWLWLSTLMQAKKCMVFDSGLLRFAKRVEPKKSDGGECEK